MSKNILKKKKIRKDYKRRNNIMIAELKLIRKGKRKGFGISLPKSRKIVKSKPKKIKK